MTLDWMQEEKTLCNIIKLIPIVCGMDNAQLRICCQKLQPGRERMFPGHMGRAFFKYLAGVSGGKIIMPANDSEELQADVWTALEQDAGLLLRLIRKYKSLDETRWRTALPKLERLSGRYFRTGLGGAFIQSLKEKTDNETQLEEIAAWLMEDTQGRMQKTKRAGRFFFPVNLRKAAVPLLACLSACFLTIWLYGQAEKVRSSRDLQRMKEVAFQQPSGKQTASEKAGLLKKAGIPKTKRYKQHPKKLPQYEEMSEKYPQLFGWLKIPDSQIDLPVMKSESGEGFYLNHDFSGRGSAEGALFVDEKSSVYPQDSNTVIYGHNMKNGHMFGSLLMYKDAAYFEGHRTIYFDTLYETGEYEAAAVLKTGC